MRLTKKRAIDLSIEQWTWLAETGKQKEEWPEWEKYGYDIIADCFLCEYQEGKDPENKGCSHCPLKKPFGNCYGSAFVDWEEAQTLKDKKKYASLFLEQLKAIRRG